jgi:hypothetical protein
LEGWNEAMQFFNIPDNVIDGVASEIHNRTTRDYHIPIVGAPDNLETPQVFEIMPFDLIDSQSTRFYAIDGSRITMVSTMASHSAFIRLATFVSRMVNSCE